MSEHISLRKANAERWRELHKQQAASGKSLEAFCVEQGINHHTFRYWCAKFSRGVRAGANRRTGSFIAIVPNKCESGSPRIFLPNGVTIDLGDDLGSADVKDFLLGLCGVGGGVHAKS